MDFSLNTIIIIVMLLMCAGFIYMFVKEINTDNEDMEEEQEIDEAGLIKAVAETFSSMQKLNLNDLNLSRDELEKRNAQKAQVRRYLKEAAYGNRQAKREIKDMIVNIMQDVNLNLVNEDNIDNIIKFNSPTSLTIKDKFEILMYIYMNVLTYLDDDGLHKRTYGDTGFEQMIKDYKLNRPRYRKDKNTYYEISAEDIERVYADVIKKYPGILKTNDKYQILAQRVFEHFKGFGAADLLFDNVIDEIDAGVSGIPKGTFEIKTLKENLKKGSYSYESVWIMLHGLNIRLSFLSFGSQEELVRVCQNIYKFNAPSALSRRTGKIISSMKDGSRVVVARPPFSDGWVFFVRKFDSTPSIAPEELFKDEGSEYVINMIKWIVLGHRNAMITGDQGTGKTTFLKSIMRFIHEYLTIRIQEKAFEMNLRFVYPEMDIVTFQETDTISMQEGIDTQKKTNGCVNIFGEIADILACALYLQTCRVASYFGFGTHHAKTARALIKTFTVEGETEESVSQTINFDIHLEKEEEKAHRFCRRITEIVPIRDRRYPSEIQSTGVASEDLMMDTKEFEKRMTDRQIFETIDLIFYKDGRYYVNRIPTKEMRLMMEQSMSATEKAQFRADMKKLNAVAITKVSEDEIDAA